MATLRTIRNRIGSVEKIKKIANALEIVALTRLKRMEEETLASRSYFDAIRQMLFDLATHINFKSHPFLIKHPSTKAAGIVCIFSDKGLCGSFNANVASQLLEFISAYKDKKISVALIGKKGMRYFKQRPNYEILSIHSSTDKVTIEKGILDIAQSFIERFLSEDLDEIFLLYSRFRRHLLGEVKLIKLFPLVLEEIKFEKPGKFSRDYIYEPTAYEIFDSLVREYIINQIHQGILESRCAEEMSRMLAMKSASDNAEEMIGELKLTYNKTRQAQITKELTEVMAAAEAS